MSPSIHSAKGGIRRLVLTCLGGVCIWLSTSAWIFSTSSQDKDSADIEQAFLQAERETEKGAARKQWKALLEQIKGRSDLPPYITAESIQRIIIDLYVQPYVRSGKQEAAIEAYDYIRQVPDKEMRLWGLAHLLYQMTKRSSSGMHPDLLPIAQDSIDSIYHDAIDLAPEVRGRLYYTLATIMTGEAGQQAYSEKELQRVHALIMRVEQPGHRLELIRRFGALSKVFSPSLYPATFHPLYRAFAESQPETEQLLVIHRDAVAKDHFHAALYALLAIKDGKIRTVKLKEYYQALVEEGAISRARRVAEQTDNLSACVYMWSGLMREYLYYGYDLKAKSAQDHGMQCADAMDDAADRQQAVRLIEERQAEGRDKHGQYTQADPKKKEELERRIDQALRNKGVAQAAALVREESDTKLRVGGFHYLARRQATTLDRYRMLTSGPLTEGKDPLDSVSYVLGPSSDISSPGITEVKMQEAALRQHHGANASNIMAYEGIPSAIGQVIHFMRLPQQAEISGKVVRAKIPLPQGGRIILSHYESNIFNSSFTRLLGNSGFVLGQQSAAPLAITVENGVFDLMAIYDGLIDLGNLRCMEKNANIYTLRCPLIVGTDATLVLSGDTVSELRLSAQARSYIINANTLYVTDVTLMSWDEDKKEPMWLDYDKRYRFRPFFTSWNRSYSYIGNSEIIALGYDHGKSYGISFSSGPNNWENLGEIDNHDRPTGIIVNNSFHNMMFGFYSYEAYNAVLVGNEYIDNVVYGIDPHDRSTHLVIAYNTAYGSTKKHGIIISREVKKSLIAGNLSFDNRGSGIMLDRESDETLIYANTAFANDGEGIALFESNCSIIAANLLFQNKGSGVRLRNSHDIGLYYNRIMHNNHGITAYSLALEDDPNHRHRNFTLDPYYTLTTFSAVGNKLEGNRTGIFVDDIDGMFLKANSYINQAPSLFRGDWFATRVADIMQMDRQAKGAVLSRICPTTRTVPSQHSCIFRENGTLRGDGMDLLLLRLSLPQCKILQADIRTARKETTQ